MLLNPLFVQAGTFSFINSLLQQLTPTTSASSGGFNSQTMMLLEAAHNLDLNPPVGGGDITVVDGSALMAQAGPQGTLADIPDRPAASQISVYTVRPGDTLSEIAAMFNVSVNTIVWANDIQGGVIHPGDSLIILPITGIRHTVVKSETLASLAKAYKSDAHDIAQYNDLADTASLVVGQVVIIPNGEASTPAPRTSGGSLISKVKQLASSGKPTSKPHDVSSINEGNYYACPVAGILTQGIHGYNAVDIGAPRSTPIYAAAGGLVIVARAGGWNGGYGNYVVIAHGNGTQTLYAHMSKVLTTAGVQVGQGTEIGLVGATGEATGAHLHFEVRGAQNPFGSLSLGQSCE